MSEYIEVPVTLELSGYSRGHVGGIAYYDPETKKLVDWEYDISTYDIVRNDMEVYDEVKMFAGELNKVLRGPITEFAEKIFSR